MSLRNRLVRLERTRHAGTCDCPIIVQRIRPGDPAPLLTITCPMRTKRIHVVRILSKKSAG